MVTKGDPTSVEGKKTIGNANISKVKYEESDY
jgi:hypothetical protein